MATLVISDVLDFFAEFQQTQLRVWRACLDPSLRWIQLTRTRRALVPFIEDDPKRIAEQLHRPRRVDDGWFAREGARVVGMRAVFGAQTADIGEPAVLLYTSDFFSPGGLTTRFAITRVGQSLQIVCRHAWEQGRWVHVGGRIVQPQGLGPMERVHPRPDERSADILARQS